MLIIPAIDLKDGCVVRLIQGNFGDKTVYSKDPVKTAKHWIRQGAEFLHVVDLDGAAGGGLRNLEVLKQILKEVSVPVQFGGGVRTMETIQALIDLGVYRVVLGTKAVEDRVFLKKAFAEFKQQVIVSLDVRDGKVFIKGWLEAYNHISALEFADVLKTIGFEKLIYTDITKDGTLKGPNIRGVKELLKKTKMTVIVSGGVSSLEDLQKLKSAQKYGIEAIIIGKALYEGRFTLKEALKAV